MPRVRWIEYRGERWRMSDLARQYGLMPQTLASRLDRARLPLERALATGLCDRAEAGRRGFVVYWDVARDVQETT